MNLISFEEIINDLNISSSTLLNWIKAQIIKPCNEKFMDRQKYKDFKESFIGIEKLNKRGNKLFNKEKEINMANKLGIFYTPKYIVDEILQDLLKYTAFDNKTFCDPCCGDGEYLISALDNGITIEHLYGFDIDQRAVDKAKKRIFEKTGKEAGNVLCLDFLTYEQEMKFDIIATNPPWGSKIFKGKSKEDSSVLVFRHALKFVKEEGLLSFLVPFSWNNIKRFQSIREKLLSIQMKEIKNFGCIFGKIQEKACNFIVKKDAPSKELICSYKEKGYKRIVDSFRKNIYNIINIHISSKEQEILEYLFSLPHVTLEKNTIWGMGVVTGNNKQHVKTNGSIPIYRGKHIQNGVIENTDKYIENHFSVFQQCPPKEILFAPQKIVYRFITPQLSFAYDHQKRVFLNSANMIILEKNFPLSYEKTLFLLNSEVMNWIFQSLYTTLKVLRSDISKLPLWMKFFENYKEKINYTEDNLLEYLKLQKKTNGSYTIKR